MNAKLELLNRRTVSRSSTLPRGRFSQSGLTDVVVPAQSGGLLITKDHVPEKRGVRILPAVELCLAITPSRVLAHLFAPAWHSVDQLDYERTCQEFGLVPHRSWVSVQIQSVHPASAARHSSINCSCVPSGPGAFSGGIHSRGEPAASSKRATST